MEHLEVRCLIHSSHPVSQAQQWRHLVMVHQQISHHRWQHLEAANLVHQNLTNSPFLHPFRKSQGHAGNREWRQKEAIRRALVSCLLLGQLERAQSWVRQGPRLHTRTIQRIWIIRWRILCYRPRLPSIPLPLSSFRLEQWPLFHPRSVECRFPVHLLSTRVQQRLRLTRRHSPYFQVTRLLQHLRCRQLSRQSRRSQSQKVERGRLSQGCPQAAPQGPTPRVQTPQSPRALPTETETWPSVHVKRGKNRGEIIGRNLSEQPLQ